MKYLLIICFIPILAFAQVNPIDPNHTLVTEAFGRLAEIKPDIEYKIPFSKKASYSQILFHRTAYDTAAEYELFFTLKKKTTTPVPVIVEQVIDDRNSLIKYNPAWVQYTNPVYQDGTAQFTTSAGATATLTFTGNRVQYHAEKRMNHGKAGIKIDGGDWVIVDLYSTETGNVRAMLFDSGPLENKEHTIVVRMTGDKNEAWTRDFPSGTTAQNLLRQQAAQNNIIIDYFKFFKVQ